MWTVVYITAVGQTQSRVSVVGLGFTDDPESKKMYEFFNAGNAHTLKQLQQLFAPKR